MDTLGDDMEDFFFGCPIRGVQSVPMQGKLESSEESPLVEHPMKKVAVWLKIPTGVEKDANDELRSTSRSIKVEVRVYKAGTRTQHHKVRKCARCARYAPNENFSELRLEDLTPVTIEEDG